MKKFLSIILSLAMLFSLCSCTNQNEEKNDEVLFYFSNKEGNSLVYEERKITKQKTVDETVEAVIHELLLGPKNKEYVSAVRAGVKLLSVKSDDLGKVKVNFSREFYNKEAVFDILSASSIVKSLCTVDGVKRVAIYVEDMPLVGPSGVELGYLTQDDLVFDITATSQNDVYVNLYFSDKEALYFVKERRQINVPTGESVEKMIVSELIKGPKKDNSMKTVPQETKIRSVETKDRVCFVNLSNEFITKQTGGSAMEYMTIYSIVNSLTELANIDKVQFLIEGEKKETMIHFSLTEPFEREEAMIR